MKRQFIHKIQALALAVSLLFGQFGIAFFHNEHDAHATYRLSAIHGSVLLKHGEHCKVCSVDLFHSFIEQPVLQLTSENTPVFLSSAEVITRADQHADQHAGRAPPTLL